MRSTRILSAFLLLFVLTLGACSRDTRQIPATYTVRPGDTLYAIAWRHNLDYHVLARWNNLPADYRIEVGQVLYLRPRGVQSMLPPAAAGKPAKPVTRARPVPVRPVAAVAQWVWPAEGRANIVRHTATDSQGLLISGAEGAPVRAAAPGTVVYTGSGLLGFGNLVIVKHTETFLSAYGHNRELMVKEGETVSAGQSIAVMGLGPGQKPALYFEIRYEGRPVDPLAYLPSRP
jgi:lipoprotein NlpD